MAGHLGLAAEALREAGVGYLQVQTTTDSRVEAMELARAAVEARLAACAQVSGPIASTYWWEGGVERAEEWMLTLKLPAHGYEALAGFLMERHSYDEPEIVATPIVAGSPTYLSWIKDETRVPVSELRGAPMPSARETPGWNDHGDDGLFGPASVTWQVMAQPVMWVAGFRALYLQALHPKVMRGTWQNTAFADPKQAWGRFVRTTEFVRVRTYGSRADVERAARRVRKLHAALRGADEDGTPFRLDEPELLLWVHCAEVSSYADVARRSGVRLSAADLDAFVDEQRRAAAVVGLDPAAVPGSLAGLDRYFEAVRPRLRATPQARRALLRSLNPAVPAQYLPLKLLVPGLTTLGFASMPRWARRLYGAPATPLTDMAATASLRALQEGAARLPAPFMPPAVRSARERVRDCQRARMSAQAAG